MKTRPEIVLEIGATHCGFADALKLIDATKAGGADAIKVQICSPELMVHPDHPLTVTYKQYYKLGRGIGLETVTEDMATILERRKLSPEEWKALIKYAHEQDLKFYATVGSLYDLSIANLIWVDGIKICSGDVTYHQLIHEAAMTGIPIQLDTANSTLEEIQNALEIIWAPINPVEVTIHHCPSGYPAPNESVNLNALVQLICTFDNDEYVKHGFSDHSLNHTACVIATSMGVDYIEKTLTSSRYQAGPEHCFSLEPNEIADFVALIRSVPILMGKADYEIDHKKQASIRRGVYYTQAKHGETEITEFLRPFNGTSPADVYKK